MARSSSSNSKTTRNRRAAKPKAQPEAPQPEVQEEAPKLTMNQKVVARRLAFLPDAERSVAAERFANGESIRSLAEEFGLSVTRAAYCLRQELVTNGNEHTIDPEDVGAIKATYQDEDLAWTACRAGVSGGRIQAVVSESAE